MSSQFDEIVIFQESHILPFSIVTFQPRCAPAKPLSLFSSSPIKYSPSPLSSSLPLPISSSFPQDSPSSFPLSSSLPILSASASFEKPLQIPLSVECWDVDKVVEWFSSLHLSKEYLLIYKFLFIILYFYNRIIFE